MNDMLASMGAMSSAFIKYITPFGYCEGADIVNNGTLEGKYIAVGFNAKAKNG